MRVASFAIALASSVAVGNAFTTNVGKATTFVSGPNSSILVKSPSHNNIIHKRVSKPLFMSFEETEEIELDTEERMGKSTESVKKNLQTIRTGRANAAILDLVTVDYYGAPTPLNQMASISVPNSQQLNVDPYDKSVTGDIEKAIIESGLGLTPNNDGTLIRINIPQITEDRRKELLKQCKAIGEDGKVAVRNVRRDGVEAVKKIEKAGDIGEDESKGSQDSIQKLTDKFVKEIDTIVSSKEKEVMTV
jgi:ribosome recycling factor